MSRYACVVDQRAAGFPVTKACEIVEVSTSGFYDWCTREAAEPTELAYSSPDLSSMPSETRASSKSIVHRGRVRPGSSCSALRGVRGLLRPRRPPSFLSGRLLRRLIALR